MEERMKKMKKKLLLLLLFALFLSACGKKAKIESLKKETKELSDKIDSIFVNIIRENDRLANFLVNLLDNKEKYDLSTENMMVKDGGKYDYFNNKFIYKPEDDGGPMVYYSSINRITEKGKKVILLTEKADSLLKKIVKDNPFITSSWIFHKFTIARGYPFFDVPSTFPPDLNFLETPFWVRCTYKNNPEKKSVWSPVDEPYVGMSGEGWMMSRETPIYEDDDNRMDYLSSVDIRFSVLNNKLLSYREKMVLLVSESLALIGTSDIAKETLNLKILEDYDYLQQMQTHDFIQESFHLTHESQSEDIQALGEKIPYEREFELNIDNVKYYVSVEKTTDPLFYIVGVQEL